MNLSGCSAQQCIPLIKQLLRLDVLIFHRLPLFHFKHLASFSLFLWITKNYKGHCYPGCLGHQSEVCIGRAAYLVIRPFQKSGHSYFMPSRSNFKKKLCLIQKCGWRLHVTQMWRPGVMQRPNRTPYHILVPSGDFSM